MAFIISRNVSSQEVKIENRKKKEKEEAASGTGDLNLPSNLLDDLAHKGSSLAQVALGPGDTRLNNSGSGFL